MDNNQIYNKIKEDELNQKRTSIMKRTEPKSYDIDFESEKKLSIFGSYLFSLISIVCALYFVYSILIKAIPIDILSWVLASTLLIFIELLKHFTIPKSVRNYYNRNVINIPHALLVCVLLVASVYLSTKGIEQYANEKVAEKPNLVDINQIKNVHDIKIKAIENQKANFLKSIEWNGKVNIYDQTTANTLKNFDQRIQTIQKEKDKSLLAADKENSNTISKTESNNNTNILYLVVFSMINEILCLLCLWYPIHYDFTSVKYIQKEIELGTVTVPNADKKGMVTVPDVDENRTVTVPDKTKNKEIKQSAEGMVTVPKNTLTVPTQNSGLFPKKININKDELGLNNFENKAKKNEIGFRYDLPNSVKNNQIEPKMTSINNIILNGKGHPVICENCGEKCFRKSSQAKYCGDKCRIEHNKLKK